jgi:hypothetical protein
MSPELAQKVAVWRQQAKDGTLTVEQYKDIIASIRGDRKTAAVASEQSKRAKAKAVIPDAKALLNDLQGLK